MIESSRRVVCLTIAEKINTIQPIHIGDVHEIDTLVTELHPDDPILKPYVNLGIEVV